MKLAHACAGECMFSEVGLLTADKKLDKAAIIKYFAQTDATRASAVNAAIEKCYGSYMADVDTSLECKSGAFEFQRCLMRQTFLDCPSSLWLASSECVELKAKITKCPMIPVKMGGGPGRPRQ